MPSSYPYPYPEEIQRSLHILGYNENTVPSSLKELNKRYHMLALIHHPDKCVQPVEILHDKDNEPTQDHEHTHATEKFKDINQAHKCLLEYFYSSSGVQQHQTDNAYNSIFQLFIQTMVSKHDTSAAGIQMMIHHIITKGIQSAITIFSSMDKQTTLMIYDILSKNQDLFGISHDTMDELTKIMEEKTSADIVIRLNPSLLDMLLDRVYILHESGHTYYIPLWHSELHFKIGSTQKDRQHIYSTGVSSEDEGELIVLCDPELPDNVTIDDHNHIYISLDVSINELFRAQVLPVIINEETKANNILYYLHAADVTLRTDITQRVLLHGCGGIALICNNTSHTNDMYKVDKRANVYANIRLIA
jgi:hypothetical protein